MQTTISVVYVPFMSANPKNELPLWYHLTIAFSIVVGEAVRSNSRRSPTDHFTNIVDGGSISIGVATRGSHISQVPPLQLVRTRATQGVSVREPPRIIASKVFCALQCRSPYD